MISPPFDKIFILCHSIPSFFSFDTLFYKETVFFSRIFWIFEIILAEINGKKTNNRRDIALVVSVYKHPTYYSETDLESLSKAIDFNFLLIL